MLNLNDLTPAEFEDFFNSIELVMSDCDGVLWRGGTLPGCGDVIEKIREMGKKVMLISNNSIYRLEVMKDNIEKAKIYNFPDEDLVTPATTIVNYLKSINFTGKVYALCSDAMVETLTEAGFQCDNGASMSARNLMDQLDLDADVGVVIVDTDVTLNYMKISKAIHYLKRNDVLFIAGATDELYPVKSSMIVIGPGYFIKLIAMASGHQPMVLGKPGRGLGEILTKKYSITDPKKVLFIGDSLEQDIVFAQEQGYRSLLVLTGLADMKTAEAGIHVKANSDKTKLELFKPEFYIESLADLKPKLEQMTSLH